MLKRLVWTVLATANSRNFESEHEEIAKVSCQQLLENLILHAYNNVPYYRELLKKVDVIRNGRLHLENPGSIPILTKEILRRRADELVSRDHRARGSFYDFSSGSTGEPVKFMIDKAHSRWVWATSKYYFESILGHDETFSRRIHLWGPPMGTQTLSQRLTYTLSNALTNSKYLDPRRMNESDMERYVRVINSYKPRIIRGYAHALYEISKFIEKKGLAVHKPAAVISSAEMLHEYMREKIEAVFGTKAFNFYGCREVDGIAGECREGLMHIFAFNNFVEVVEAGSKKASEGETGRVIVTNLHNYSMPFIRYQLGDMAVLGPEKCRCGNRLPTLKNITGRMNDYLRKEDGTIVSAVYFLNIFRLRESVKAFRIVQEDYKRIRIIVAFRELAKVESEKTDIEEKIGFAMGRDCRIIWEIVDDIPEGAAGKYTPVRSLLSIA